MAAMVPVRASPQSAAVESAHMVVGGATAKSVEALRTAHMVVSGTFAKSARATAFAHMVVSSTIAKSAEAVPSARMVGTGTIAKSARAKAFARMVVGGTNAKSAGAVASAHMVVSGAIAKSAEAVPSAHMVVSGAIAKSAEAVPSARMVASGTCGALSSIHADTLDEVNALTNAILPTKDGGFSNAIGYDTTTVITKFVVRDSNSAELSAFAKNTTLDIAQANQWVPSLLKTLASVRNIIKAYDRRVDDSFAYAVFFGYTDVTISTVAHDMHTALTKAHAID